MANYTNRYKNLWLFSSMVLILISNTLKSKTVIAQEENNDQTINESLYSIASVNPLSLGENLFREHYQEIQEYLPPNWNIRLPENITLNYPPSLNKDDYKIQILPISSESGLRINLIGCENEENLCLLGDIVMKSKDSLKAEESLNKHQLDGYLVTLSDEVEAYYLEGKDYGSIAWQQDDLIYQAKLPIQEKQNLLYMALSMVNSDYFNHENITDLAGVIILLLI
jgi:hypothetical protein